MNFKSDLKGVEMQAERMFSKLPIIQGFLGFPIKNYATSGAAVLVDQLDRQRVILPASGKVTRVPNRIIDWEIMPDGTPVAVREFLRPRNLPEEDEVVSVLTASTYAGIHRWNENCEIGEEFNLGWSLVLGEPMRDEYGDKISGLFRGLLMTEEALANRRLVPQEIARGLDSRRGVDQRPLFD